MNRQNNNAESAEFTERVDTVTEFLDALHPERNGDIPYLWGLRDKRSTCFRDHAEMAKRAVQISDSGDHIYFGVCRTAEKIGSNERAKNSNVRFVPGLYAEIDTAGHINSKGEKVEGLPTKEYVLLVLQKMPIPPSIIIDTGGGFHVYWIFHEPFEIKSEKDRRYISWILKGWQSLLARKLKITIDSVADLARVLRLPGTINHKYGTQVRIESPTDGDLSDIVRSYPDDFEPFIEDEEPVVTKTAERSDWDGPPSDADTVLASCKFLRHCRDDAATLPEPHWHPMISNIARTEGGEKLCREFSKPYPGYSKSETDEKIRHALNDAGPHTCKHIAEITNEKWCEGCPGLVENTSPVAMGIVQEKCEPPPGRVCNGYSKDGKVVPVPMDRILGILWKGTGDWPRRVGSALFVHEDGNHIDWLEKTPALFGYLGKKLERPSRFLTSPGLHTKAEVFAELQRTATAYECVETLPHEPKMKDHYYACDWPTIGNGDHLRELVSRFNPETPIDGDLITAYFVSTIWGGKGGTKPAFLIDSKDGRGVGKSTLAEMGGHLAGGLISLSANESAEVIKQRLLSPEGAAKRIALLDNIKSLKFSWSELEALITASVISGKRMYVGEGRRPNNLLWCLTLNGASLSTDIAQRCVILRVKRPTYSGNWKEKTQQFIDDNRQQIIGDIIGLLRGPRHQLQQYSRWGAWECDVLERLPDPAETQAVILERQKEADVECEESSILEDYVRGKLDSLDYCPSANRVFLPTSLMGEWYNQAHNERVRTAAVTRIIKQKISEGKLQRLVVCASRTHGRGFEWIGEDWTEDSGFMTDINVKIVNKG